MKINNNATPLKNSLLLAMQHWAKNVQLKHV